MATARPDGYDLLKPALFALPPETAHGLTKRALGLVQHTPVEQLLRSRYVVDDPRIRVDAFGERFPSPVGVAAGFDKNAEVPSALAALGFGFVEVGGVTADPQQGNHRPRLFRLPEDRALVNRMGFNGEGADAVGERLDRQPLPDVPIGVNVAKSESTALADAPADYRYTYERVGAAADYVVVNVSCPNTPDIRKLQNRDSLASILGELRDAGASRLLVKLSPDLPEPAVEDAVDVVNDLELEGVIASNTTTERPADLQDSSRVERGGLSGAPVEERATEQVRFVARRTDRTVIGVGGVDSAESAYRKIRAGADLVQLYTGLVYEGPGLARAINRGLLDLLDRDGFDSVSDAVGADL